MIQSVMNISPVQGIAFEFFRYGDKEATWWDRGVRGGGTNYRYVFVSFN